MKEVWRDVKDYEGLYKVSSYGRIRNNKRLLVRKPNLNGYMEFDLRKNGIRRQMKLHRLVAIAFIPLVKDKNEINHIDGNKLNNRIENIEWCNRSENVKHAFDIGLKTCRGVKNSQAKLEEWKIKVIRGLYRMGKYTQKEIGDFFGVGNLAVSRIVNNISWTHIK